MIVGKQSYYLRHGGNFHQGTESTKRQSEPVSPEVDHDSDKCKNDIPTLVPFIRISRPRKETLAPWWK